MKIYIFKKFLPNCQRYSLTTIYPRNNHNTYDLKGAMVPYNTLMQLLHCIIFQASNNQLAPNQQWEFTLFFYQTGYSEVLYLYAWFPCYGHSLIPDVRVELPLRLRKCNVWGVTQWINHSSLSFQHDQQRGKLSSSNLNNDHTSHPINLWYLASLSKFREFLFPFLSYLPWLRYLLFTWFKDLQHV